MSRWLRWIRRALTLETTTLTAAPANASTVIVVGGSPAGFGPALYVDAERRLCR